MLPVPNLDSFQRQLDDLRRRYQAMTIPQTQAPALSSGSTIKYVDGIDKAKEYQANMAPGASEIIMDKNEDMFYVVSKETNGSSPKLMTIGRFTLEQEEAPEAKYITKTDFEAFKQEVVSLLKEVKHE